MESPLLPASPARPAFFPVPALLPYLPNGNPVDEQLRRDDLIFVDRATAVVETPGIFREQ